jgi:tellurium resistance protein TerZ
MSKIKTGESRILNVTDQGHRRIFVGLKWDPTPKQTSFARLQEAISGHKAYHDLDLSCFVYNRRHECISVISGKTAVSGIDAIYHSGDDPNGHNSLSGDDEQISVELAHLPDEVQTLVFKIEVLSSIPFSEIKSPLARMVDGYSNYHFLKIPLSHEKKAAYVMALVYRSDSDKNQWMFKFVNAYEDPKPVSRWKQSLKDFTSRA